MCPALVEPHFLMPYPKPPQPPQVDDYRCAINAQGTGLVFERSQTYGGPYTLFYLDLTPTPPRRPSNPHSLAGGDAMSRPDWSWTSNLLVCASPEGILSLNIPPLQIVEQLIPNTKAMTYPVWTPDGKIVVMDNRHKANPAKNPSPSSSLIDVCGTVVRSPLAGPSIWAGMPSLHPHDPSKIVFAGQHIGTKTKYNQEQNYVWYVDTTDLTTLRPLDKGVTKPDEFDPKFQGRAPWWSPDGKWVAFESNRASSDGELYAIYIQDAAGENPAMQVTDLKWDGNHPKWYPDGKKLVAAMRQDPASKPRGMASLDVSAFV